MNKTKNNKGKIKITLNEKEYIGQYEVSKVVDFWFDLTVWYKGKCKKERVPAYSANFHYDVQDIHGPTLLKVLVKEGEGIP